MNKLVLLIFVCTFSEYSYSKPLLDYKVVPAYVEHIRDTMNMRHHDREVAAYYLYALYQPKESFEKNEFLADWACDEYRSRAVGGPGYPFSATSRAIFKQALEYMIKSATFSENIDNYEAVYDSQYRQVGDVAHQELAEIEEEIKMFALKPTSSISN